MATTIEIKQAHRDLLARAAQLVEERDDLPAGSVLRSFSRAVRRLRLEGCPATEMASRADRITRAMLGERSVGVVVPRPR